MIRIRVCLVMYWYSDLRNFLAPNKSRVMEISLIAGALSIQARNSLKATGVWRTHLAMLHVWCLEPGPTCQHWLH